MKCFVVFAGLAVAASAAPSVIVRQALSGPEFPKARTCTPTGTKCAGDEGYPSIPYAACCENDMTCGFPLVSAGTWGRYCLPATAVTTNKTEVVSAAPTTTVEGATTTVAATTVTDKDGKVITTTTIPVKTDASGSTITSTTTNKTDDGSVCFPAGATVELENGDVVRMSSISVGDVVKVGLNRYSRVFMFTHKLSDTVHKFVTLHTASGVSLSLTKGHYLYVNDVLSAASTVSIGDRLTLGSGETSPVVAVETTTASGLFNPQTIDGNIVVNGVLSSTYTTAVEPSFAHALLAPLRLVSNVFGVSMTSLESGSDALAAVAPQGPSVL